MKVHIFPKQKGKDFIEDVSSREDKAKLAKSLPDRLANLDFDSASVSDNGYIYQFTDLPGLIKELVDE